MGSPTLTFDDLSTRATKFLLMWHRLHGPYKYLWEIEAQFIEVDKWPNGHPLGLVSVLFSRSQIYLY